MASARICDGDPTRLLVVGLELAAEFSAEIESDGDADADANADESAIPSAGVDEFRTVSTVADALELLESDAGTGTGGDEFDCLLAAQELPDGTGVELLEAIRGRDCDCDFDDDYDRDHGPVRKAAGDAELPVVLAPADGNEALASDAVAAGVTEYVSRSSAPDSGSHSRAAGEELAAALERAITRGRTRKGQRAQARQFEAIFDDPETYAWVLDPDGTVRRANESALDAIAETADDVRGRAFWTLPWWERTEDGQTMIRRAVEQAASGTGTVAHRELTRVEAGAGDTQTQLRTQTQTQTLDLTVRPVTDDSETVTALFVQATDVTERAALERELRESEELHRVTLNHMTDTVLITDDEGEFTYVCPNVHFIFGYTDDEIRELGSIEDLLGTDLFDRDELAEDGVLTNIECTATDEAGREHTLLVNVREVSIQDGTILYSCRDITKRKRREEALTALHRTSRELLYAETDREIADVTVDDATDVLDLAASAVYLFDTDENELRPAARSAAMAERHGPLSPQQVGDSITGDVFVDGESRFLADVHDSPLLAEPTTELRSAAFVPLGDHGVFVAGSTEVGVFDDVSREVTDLLAATAEAALDRVEREQTLRERDRELKRRNRQLTRLDQINEIIRELDQALVQAETRAEIERAVCDRLTAEDRFSFAWIGASDPGDDRLESRAHGGADRGRDYLDSVSLSLPTGADDADEDDRLRGREPAVRTAATRDVTVVPNVVDDLRDQPWRSEALTREYQSIISVPLSYDEFTYGVVTVYADQPDAFDDVTRAVLAELGETIASAIAAVERKRALLSNTNTRLEFDVDDESFVFTRLARRAECTISFDGGVRQHEDGAAVFATVEGAPPERVVTAAAELVAVEDAQSIGGSGGGDAGDAADADTTDDTSGGTVRLQLSQPFLALQLADHGVVLRRVEATPGTTRVVVDVPDSVDDRGSADIVANAFSNADLRSKRRIDRTTPQDLRSELLDRLTDRQLEVVQLAYYGGYFESPRERSGEEVAETLSISPAAFYRHNRTVQRKLFSILFDELGVPASTAPPVE